MPLSEEVLSFNLSDFTSNQLICSPKYDNNDNNNEFSLNDFH